MNDDRDEVMDQLRIVRREYDTKLSPGDRAVLRRCREPEEVMLEGVFWRLCSVAKSVGPKSLARVVFLFPACEAARADRRGFGRFLNQHLAGGKKDSQSAALRFRRLLAAPDADALALRLRRLLTSLQAPLDWGVLGHDLIRWQRSRATADGVFRQWAQDFYAPMYEAAEKRPRESVIAEKEIEG